RACRAGKVELPAVVVPALHAQVGIELIPDESTVAPRLGLAVGDRGAGEGGFGIADVLVLPHLRSPGIDADVHMARIVGESRRAESNQSENKNHEAALHAFSFPGKPWDRNRGHFDTGAACCKTPNSGLGTQDSGRRTMD